MIDIQHHRGQVFNLLQKVSPDAPASFGIMTPQHMVEHLTLVIRFSNGKLPQKLYYREEKAEKFKQYTIFSDKELMPGFKAPMLSDDLYPLENSCLQDAILELKDELELFDAYFKDNPTAKPISPTLGALDYNEWVIFHNKHIKHHLKQFALI